MNVSSGQGSALDVQQLIAQHRSGCIQGRIGASQSRRSVFGTETAQETQGSFADVLKSKVSGLKFSAHAATRIKSRNIDLSPEVMGKLENAVSGAENKGARDSLILMNDLAFIVNIPNKTVVTAMDGESIRDNVFTNIDSTVIAG